MTKDEANKRRIGLYSAEAATRYGSRIYGTPDGREVEVTAAYYDPWAASEYAWQDGVFVGEITEDFRQGQKPSRYHSDGYILECEPHVTEIHISNRIKDVWLPLLKELEKLK